MFIRTKNIYRGSNLLILMIKNRTACTELFKLGMIFFSELQLRFLATFSPKWSKLSHNIREYEFQRSSFQMLELYPGKNGFPTRSQVYGYYSSLLTLIKVF